MDVRIFKSLDRATASLEVWDGAELVAEVFADSGGVRRLHVSKEAVSRGIDWDPFSELVPSVTEILDKADEEMRLSRKAVPEP